MVSGYGPATYLTDWTLASHALPQSASVRQRRAIIRNGKLRADAIFPRSENPDLGNPAYSQAPAVTLRRIKLGVRLTTGNCENAHENCPRLSGGTAKLYGP